MSITDPRKGLLLVAMVPWAVVEGCKAPPITISQSHMEAVFAAGSTFRLFMDSTSQPVSVGGTGGPHIYDFRHLSFFLYDSVSMFSVTRIPQLATRFPANAVTFNEEDNTVYPVFAFSDHSFDRLGRARIVSDSTEWYQHISPAAEWLRFPVRFNTRYTPPGTVVVETTYVNRVPIETSADTSSGTYYVDGYGTLLLPGGLALRCLRMRMVASPPRTAKEFQFWTREGAVILIDSENSQPDTGVVRRGYVIYFSPQDLHPGRD